MTRARRSAAVVVAAVLLPVAVLGPAEAGIVVLKTGQAIVGRIDPRKDVTAEAITVHAPEGEGGVFVVERHKVRWFDAAADAPTPAYWELFRVEPIEARWHGHRDAWDAAQLPDPIDPVPVPAPPVHPLGLPIAHARFSLEPPLGWAAHERDGITIVEGRPGEAGYAPRIQAFAVETLSGAPEDLERLIEEELNRLPGVESFEVTELSRPRAVAGGTDQELVTRTRIAGREVRALRRVSIRQGWTVIAAGYADAREFDLVRPQLQRSLATLAVR